MVRGSLRGNARHVYEIIDDNNYYDPSHYRHSDNAADIHDVDQYGGNFAATFVFHAHVVRAAS